MKKILCMLLVLLLLLTACSSEKEVKTEAELKAEIRAELEAEQKAEMEQEQETEQDTEKLSESKDKKSDESAVNQDFENGIEFSGELTCNTAPYVLMIYNEYNKAVVNGKEYDCITLEKDIISKYVKRQNFSYHIEGFPMIDSNDYLDMTIEFDPTTAYETMGNLMVKDYRVIEDPYNNGTKLTDYSNEPYSTTYYQDVIKTLCLGMFGAESEDAKKNPGYESNADFKEAVDTILSKGYKLVQNNGYYKAVNENAYNIDHMPTVSEMCNIVGIDINDITTNEDNGYYLYSSHYSNDEIGVYINHDEKLQGDDLVTGITVKGIDYKLYGISLGNTLLNTYDKIDEKYDGMYNMHDDSYAKYVFDVDGYAFTLNNIGWEENAQIEEYDLVRQISCYELVD